MGGEGIGEGPSRSRRSLTGVWQGIYSYPVGGLPTVPFTATLIEAGSSVSGSGHEQSTVKGATLLFSVSGRRHDAAVNFIKIYAGGSPHYGTIIYEGTANDDATEIEGRWIIQRDWSGRFLMTRSGDALRAAAESEGAASRLPTAEMTPAR
jgi:hypothetical protein